MLKLPFQLQQQQCNALPTNLRDYINLNQFKTNLKKKKKLKDRQSWSDNPSPNIYALLCPTDLCIF